MRVLLVLAAAVTVFAIQHRCTMEEHQKPLPPPPELPAGRSLQDYREDDYEPIRIHIEYGDLDVDSDAKDMIKDKIVHGTVEWYENVLQIKRIKENLKMTIDDCEGVDVPSSHMDDGVEADVIIYVTAGEEDDSAVGWAVVCGISAD